MDAEWLECCYGFSQCGFYILSPKSSQFALRSVFIFNLHTLLPHLLPDFFLTNDFWFSEDGVNYSRWLAWVSFTVVSWCSLFHQFSPLSTVCEQSGGVGFSFWALHLVSRGSWEIEYGYRVLWYIKTRPSYLFSPGGPSACKEKSLWFFCWLVFVQAWGRQVGKLDSAFSPAVITQLLFPHQPVPLVLSLIIIREYSTCSGRWAALLRFLH